MRKELWSPEEDEKLKQYILKHGYNSWTEVSIKAGLRRGGKSCRLRWINYLRPGLRRCKFSENEKNLVMGLHKIYGNRWSKIASHVEGRTDNDVKNLWNSEIRRCHQTKLKNNQNHALPLPNKSLVNLIIFDNPNNYSSIQEKKEEQHDLITDYQVLNMLPISFPFSLDPIPINIVDSYGIDAEHGGLCHLEYPVNKLLFPELNIMSIHSVEINEKINIDRTPKLEVDQESSMSKITSLDQLPIKSSNYSCDSLCLITTNEDQFQDNENLNHFSYPWSWYNFQAELNDFMGHNGILMKDNLANHDDGNSSITTSHYEIPPLPPKFSPSSLVCPIFYPQHDNEILNHHDIEDMYLIDVDQLATRII